MRDASARLAAEVTRAQPPQGSPRSWIEPATVATVTAGGAADGNALTTVTWRGASVQAAYLASYTPTVGHRVAVVVQDAPGAWVIVPSV